MIKYFKQSWQLIRTEKLYSGLYIGGVALTIAMVMVLSIVLYSKLAPAYPEYKRQDLLYLRTLAKAIGGEDGYYGSYSSSFSQWAMQQWIDKMETVDYYCAQTPERWPKVSVEMPDNSLLQQVQLGVSETFFKVYDFDFVAGRPFTRDELEGQIRKAVITDELASKLFGNPDAAIGQKVRSDYMNFEVAGVVKAAPTSMFTYADVYIPYTTHRWYQPMEEDDYLGGFNITLVPKKGVTSEEVREEFNRLVDLAVQDLRKKEGSDVKLLTFGQPQTHYERTFKTSLSVFDESSDRYLGFYLLVALVMLIVPSMNLSGMILGRMDQRRSEMGIRKSFGARRGSLLWQVIVENLLLTLIGGAVGLILSYVIVYLAGSMIYSVIDPSITFKADDFRYTWETFFSPGLFAIAFGMCLLLNILSSYIPAWWSLRHPIVESLNENR